MAVGDFNGDGHLDLATANYTDNAVSILLGDGTGSFGAATNFSVGNSPYSVAVGDFNSDGRLDLVTANQDNTASILLGDGTGSFGATATAGVGLGNSLSSVAVGDFNGDGALDLAAASYESGNVAVLLNGCGAPPSPTVTPSLTPTNTPTATPTPTPYCGDGIVQGDEECDDGNSNNNDACKSDCTFNVCADGVVRHGVEQCDDGNGNDGDPCKSDCTLNVCGDGVVRTGIEQCDDGDRVNGDGCDSNCKPTGCGNGIATAGEECDDGNGFEGDGCDSNCRLSACGNGVRAPNEQCDDGALDDGDGCDSNCTPTGCGNGIVNAGEACDDGNRVSGDGCDDNCTPTGCGNGIVAGAEACDDGNQINGDSCNNDCTVPGCGDGTVSGAEICDDGTKVNGDGCDNNCTATGCGNGIVTDGEDCDDGNRVDGDGCDANCRLTGCGNGIVTAGEACDDGDLVNGDGCDNSCRPTGCGNGIVTTGEECDDGNAIDGDGCEANCTFTPVSVVQLVPAGGTVTTDTGGGATPAFPTQTDVTTPSDGTISITQTSSQGPPAEGFGVLGLQIQIEAPPASPTAPLQIVFLIDASDIPPQATAATLQVIKDGIVVSDCTGPSEQASPDPCVSDRELLYNGDVQLTALTSTASTWSIAAPAHDTVVLPLSPVSIEIPAGKMQVVKKLKAMVRNADVESSGHTIQLTATTNCPGAKLSTPNFVSGTPTAVDSVTLAGGKSKTATVQLTVRSSGLQTVNRLAPVRCGVTFSANTTAPAGNVDPAPSNNGVTVEVNINDKNDPEQATQHETVVRSLKPLTLSLAKTKSALHKTVTVKVGNADFLPTAEDPASHQITVTVDKGTCPVGSLGVMDYDRANAGAQNVVNVEGGTSKGGRLPLIIDATTFSTPNGKSPARCIAFLSATGPSSDADSTNNTTRLVIDVIDKKDL